MFWVQLTELEQNILFAPTPHRPQTTNHTSTFNSQIQLTRTDRTVTIKTQTTTASNVLQLKK